MEGGVTVLRLYNCGPANLCVGIEFKFLLSVIMKLKNCRSVQVISQSTKVSHTKEATYRHPSCRASRDSLRTSIVEVPRLTIPKPPIANLCPLELKIKSKLHQTKKANQGLVIYEKAAALYGEEIEKYDQISKKYEQLEKELGQVKTKIDEIKQGQAMERQDLLSRIAQKHQIINLKEETEQVINAHALQYPAEHQVIQNQFELQCKEEKLQKQKRQLLQQLVDNEKQWKQTCDNLKLKQKHCQNSETLKLIRLELIEKQQQANQKSKTPSLRQSLCKFMKENSTKYPNQQQNGVDIWICANGLLPLLVDYLNKIPNMRQKVKEYLQTFKQLNNHIAQTMNSKQQTMRKHHTKVCEENELKLEVIQSKLDKIKKQKLQLGKKLQQLFASQKQAYLRGIDLANCQNIRPILIKLERSQRNRVDNIRKSIKDLKSLQESIRKLNNQRIQVFYEVSKDNMTFYRKRQKELTTQIKQNRQEYELIRGELRKSIRHLKKDQQKKRAFKVQELCYQLGRIQATKCFSVQPPPQIQPIGFQSKQSQTDRISYRLISQTKTTKQQFQRAPAFESTSSIVFRKPSNNQLLVKSIKTEIPQISERITLPNRHLLKSTFENKRPSTRSTLVPSDSAKMIKSCWTDHQSLRATLMEKITKQRR